VGWIVFLLVIASFVAFGVWTNTTEAGKAYLAKATSDAAAKKAGKLSNQLSKGGRVNAPISQVGAGGAAGLACPRCGGSGFQAKRSRAAKVLLVPTVGVGTLLAPKTRVKCITCGTEYRRG
jgi:hypothetical protein